MENTERNAKVFEIDTNNIFKRWVEVTTPLHKLHAKDGEVFAAILECYSEMYNLTGKKEYADDILFSPELRNTIASRLGITQGHFNTCLTRLRQKNVISGNKINPKYLIKMSADGQGVISLVIQFNVTKDG